MKVVLKDFQAEYVSDLHHKFQIQQRTAVNYPAAVLLNAPTGAGKTLMVTQLIEDLLEGAEDGPGDSGLTFLWLTDQPELNRQTRDKMLSTSTVLTRDRLVALDAAFDREQFEPGRVYFLNTQKLAVTSSFVRTSDDRTFPLWTTVANTIEALQEKFVLIVDEAHRGAQGKDAQEAETIFQKFMKGSNGEVPPAPLVVGISATPSHFMGLCNMTNRPLLPTEVPVDRVRESGLLKEYVDLFHPDEPQPSVSTMLVEAAASWRGYRDQWADYARCENELVPQPVLVVQVEDAKKGTSGASSTDLSLVVGTLAKELGHDVCDGWIAHAFQDDSDLVIAGHTVRHLAPSSIDKDPDVRVVLFKTSLNTGWDCPRAEVMVSTRRAKDETNIAQLVGRMVRAPLARRIDSNEHLNTVSLYLPNYDAVTVEKVVSRLTADDSGVGPTEVRRPTQVLTLTRAAGKEDCFSVLGRLPTYVIPKARPLRPISRVAKFASLLAEMELVASPVKCYRQRLIDVLQSAHGQLVQDAAYQKLMDEARVLDIRRRRWAFLSGSDSIQMDAERDAETATKPTIVTQHDDTSAARTAIADQDLEDLHAASGRLLGEGLHKEYIRRRLTADVTAREAKLELYALLKTPGVFEQVEKAADTLRLEWMGAYKATINVADERHVQALREIESAGADPEAETIVAPEAIEWTKGQTLWDKHLYVNDGNKLCEDFSQSKWERWLVEAEIGREDIVGWLRNADRKSWSLRIPRRSKTRWVGFYPDFIFFRRTAGGVIADIVDPHQLDLADMPERAKALAKYAKDHGEHYGRIEMVIFEGTGTKMKRLDLTDEATREKVAAIEASSEQLHELFIDA